METQIELGFLSNEASFLLILSLLYARGLMRDATARILWRDLTYTATLQEDHPPHK